MYDANPDGKVLFFVTFSLLPFVHCLRLRLTRTANFTKEESVSSQVIWTFPTFSLSHDKAKRFLYSVI